MIQYADVVYDTIVDGIGLRNTLYVSGCSHNCKGCHNKALQSYNYGKQATYLELADLLTQNDNDITFSGGEPFDKALHLIDVMCAIYTNDIKAGKTDIRNYWIYSGYTFEQILQDPHKKSFLELCDVLVDGKFDINKKQEGLLFKGSINQRIIDIQASLKANKIVLWERK